MPDAYAFAGTTMTVLIPGTETDGAYAVLHVIKPPGSSTPPHSHDQELELSYVLSGILSAETEGRIETRGPGDVLVLPPGRPHRLFNESGETVREILLCAPAVFDRFVAAAGNAVDAFAAPRAATDEERRRLVETAPAFGIRLLRSAAPREIAEQHVQDAPDPWDVMGTRVEVLARFGTGDDDLALTRTTIEPGRSVPLHSHPDPESVVVFEGALEVYREVEGWQSLGPDEPMYVAPARPHALRNAGGRSARFLTVSTIRMARLLVAVGSPSTGTAARLPSPAERAAFPSLAAEFGYRLASPSEEAAIWPRQG